MIHQTPPLSVARARDEILMSLDGDVEYWAAQLDALIAAVRAERPPEIAQFLKDGETPAECVARNRRDVDSALSLLAAALKRAEAAEANLVEAGHRSLEQGERLIAWRNRAEAAEAENQRQRLREQLAKATP